MKVYDEFLPPDVFTGLQNYCLNTNFKTINVKDRRFSVMQIPDDILKFFQFEDVELILGFIRQSNSKFDTSFNIHADRLMNGQKVDCAGVLYINDQKGVTKNGTAFYKHKKFGVFLPESVTDSEYEKVILEENDKLDNYEQIDIVANIPNRFIHYKASRFHSKLPKVISEGERIVAVFFYKNKKSIV